MRLVATAVLAGVSFAGVLLAGSLSGGSLLGGSFLGGSSLACSSLVGPWVAYAQSRDAVLTFDPGKTTVDFTLGDVIHTVHGQFDLRRGSVHYSADSAAVSGDIVINAASGRSGNNTRDRKMHREILESERFPEITFRPDHVEGKVAAAGTSTVQVHGMFSIHGSEHEMTVPVTVDMAENHWNATAHFVVPYVKWGMKNPSTFILRVSESVEIEVRASGASPWMNGAR